MDNSPLMKSTMNNVKHYKDNNNIDAIEPGNNGSRSIEYVTTASINRGNTDYDVDDTVMGAQGFDSNIHLDKKELIPLQPFEDLENCFNGAPGCNNGGDADDELMSYVNERDRERTLKKTRKRRERHKRAKQRKEQYLQFEYDKITDNPTGVAISTPCPIIPLEGQQQQYFYCHSCGNLKTLICLQCDKSVVKSINHSGLSSAAMEPTRSSIFVCDGKNHIHNNNDNEQTNNNDDIQAIQRTLKAAPMTVAAVEKLFAGLESPKIQDSFALSPKEHREIKFYLQQWLRNINADNNNIINNNNNKNYNRSDEGRRAIVEMVAKANGQQQRTLQNKDDDIIITSATMITKTPTINDKNNMTTASNNKMMMDCQADESQKTQYSSSLPQPGFSEYQQQCRPIEDTIKGKDHDLISTVATNPISHGVLNDKHNAPIDEDDDNNTKEKPKPKQKEKEKEKEKEYDDIIDEKCYETISKIAPVGKQSSMETTYTTIKPVDNFSNTLYKEKKDDIKLKDKVVSKWNKSTKGDSTIVKFSRIGCNFDYAHTPKEQRTKYYRSDNRNENEVHMKITNNNPNDNNDNNDNNSKVNQTPVTSKSIINDGVAGNSKIISKTTTTTPTTSTPTTTTTLTTTIPTPTTPTPTTPTATTTTPTATTTTPITTTTTTSSSSSSTPTTTTPIPTPTYIYKNIFSTCDAGARPSCDSPRSVPLNNSIRNQSYMTPLITRKSLVGNLEEDLLQKRISPKLEMMGFRLLLSASGTFCPLEITLSADVNFYEINYNTIMYMCEIHLPCKGYTIPRLGAVQATLLNRKGTAICMFNVPYNMCDMPAFSHTFIRQRTFFNNSSGGGDGNKPNKLPITPMSEKTTTMINNNYYYGDRDRDRDHNGYGAGDCCFNHDVENTSMYMRRQQQQQQQQQQHRSQNCHNENNLGLFITPAAMLTLRDSIHLRFQTTRSGRLMLHTDIRFLISKRYDNDIEASCTKCNLTTIDKDVIIDSVMPRNPKYTKR